MTLDSLPQSVFSQCHKNVITMEFLTSKAFSVEIMELWEAVYHNLNSHKPQRVPSYQDHKTVEDSNLFFEYPLHILTSF